MEQWKRIEEFNYEYEISSYGRIRSVENVIVRGNGWKYTRKSKILKPSGSGGYLRGAVCVNKKMIPYKIHRLVALAFIPNNENKKEVNHIDGNKLNNHFDNLEWCTNKENIKHAIDNGLWGDRKLMNFNNQRSKIKKEVILNIKYLYSKGFSQCEISKFHNISQSQISRVIKGRYNYKTESHG